MIQVSPAALNTFEIFSELSVAERAQVAQTMTQFTYSTGQYIISREKPENNVFFIISGGVKACAYSENGKQVQFESLKAGMMFGELSSIDESLPSNDCIALGETMVASMSGEVFNATLDQYPSIRKLVLVRLVTLVRRHMMRVFEYSTTNVADRVKLELLRIASEYDSDEKDVVIKNPPTHSDIAARISTHREAVTRELNRLQANGAITWKRGLHVVHNKDLLLSMLEKPTV